MRKVFDDALRRQPEERARFVNEVCGEDKTLLAEVESLLSSLDNADSFMETPAVAKVADVIEAETKQLEEGKCFGHYEIIEHIGAGGMGEVYLAEDTTLNRRVALKLLPAKYTQNQEHLRRFKQEARAASALNHPNILTIHEVGEAQGSHFIATEFIDGDTLRQSLKRTGKMKTSETLAVAAQVASALVAAHEAGFVHRDIKPENIMLRRDSYVKVLDFGLAKLTEKAISQNADSDAPTQPVAHTQTGTIFGTVQYMSPEQARGLVVDARTDIWSLGCVLYEMMAGRAPFAGETVTDMLVAIVEREPPPLKNSASEQIPGELDWIITKTLRKNPDERYQTSKELLVDLQRLRQKLEIESHLERSAPPEASVEAATANTVEHRAAKHTGPLRRILSTQRTAIYAAVLIALLSGALAYVWHWRQTSVAPQSEIKSLAVLPLKSLDAGENYLGLGIADAVIRRINQTGKLMVRPTSAVRRYLNEDTDALTAARQLNADAVLEGSVQRADDRLRVSVNLLRTGDGASLWADNFDMRMTDIFTIQDTVAQQVASRLHLQLDPSQQARFMKRYTSNAIAYEFYVKGVYSFDRRGFGDKAKPQAEATIDLFKKAIEADPNYALAHAQLALAYAWTGQFIEPTEQAWVERAKEEINRVQALDPQLAETHVARHYILRSAYEGWQIEAAMRELLLAQQLNPNAGNYELGILYLHLGLEELSDRELQRALDIDPTSENAKRAIVGSYVNANRYDEWLVAQQKFFNRQPDAWYLLGKGRLNEAQTLLEQALAKEPDSLDGHRLKAILLALRGDFRAAEAEIPFLLSKRSVKAFDYHHLTYDIACVYALAGKSDEAVKWLKETAATGFQCYPLFERDPYLNRIRQAPEFIRLMAEMKAQYERYRREFASEAY
ncbi:MAG: protein kinase [Acidobacteriota bacterium]|nr:protein kinase [Acidobacteriota bacterium]